MKRWYWLLVLVLSVVLSMGIAIGCDDDDDDDDDDDEDPFGDDDDDADDDDDVVGDDDDDVVDDDDDDDDANSPQIFDPIWDPNPVAYDAAEDHWISTIFFGLCDPDNDLIGGALYVYVAGTTDLIWAEAPEWADFSGLDDVSDCTAPVDVGMGTIFAEGADPPGWGNQELCTDMEVSDGAGNFSNLVENFCVVVP